MDSGVVTEQLLKEFRREARFLRVLTDIFDDLVEWA
jgi:hypothetical protein